MISVNDTICYLPAEREPLSSDVVLIRTPQRVFIFDVGSNDRSAREIQSIPGEKTVILSHFHRDHTANLTRISYDEIYCGGFTARRLGFGKTVDAPLCLDSERALHVLPFPSSHAKGCIALCQTGKYAFLGDALYPATKDGRAFYNCQLLRETIQAVRELDAPLLGISHDTRFLRPKEELLRQLERCYAARQPGENRIEIRR